MPEMSYIEFEESIRTRLRPVFNLQLYVDVENDVRRTIGTRGYPVHRLTELLETLVGLREIIQVVTDQSEE